MSEAHDGLYLACCPGHAVTSNVLWCAEEARQLEHDLNSSFTEWQATLK